MLFDGTTSDDPVSLSQVTCPLTCAPDVGSPPRLRLVGLPTSEPFALELSIKLSSKFVVNSRKEVITNRNHGGIVLYTKCPKMLYFTCPKMLYFY